jgi:hypothetical protein
MWWQEHKDPGLKVVCSYPGQRIPDETNCNAYYYCDDYVPLHTYCAPGETFSAYSLTCIPYNPSQCFTVITAPPTTIYPVSCPYRSAIVHDPYDCAVYYLCDENYIPQYFHCSPTLWYDPYYGGCNYIERVACTAGGYRPLPIPSAIPITNPIGPAPVCTKPAEMHGNYYDCNQYWKCNQNAQPEPFVCPGDLLFDHFTNVCELYATANCQVGLLNDQ